MTKTQCTHCSGLGAVANAIGDKFVCGQCDGKGHISIVKPPLGLKPRKEWCIERQCDIMDSIERHKEAGKNVPIEWYEELCDLLNYIRTH